MGCYGVQLLERKAWPDGQPMTWVKCPKCNIEWNRLIANGICWDCDDKDRREFAQKKAIEERFKAIFGSVKAMNYYTFGKFKQTEENREAYEAARNFNSQKDNLYLWGPCGTGKSHLSYATAKMYAMNGKSVVISTPLKMVDSFRTKNDMEKESRFQEYTECDLLLIDDLGISKYTDFGLEILCEVLNRRTLQMRNGLMVTSNLSMRDLASKNDDRLASRLTGLCRIIAIIGTDYRLQGRE